MKKVLIVDGQGGRIGRQIAEILLPYNGKAIELTLVGTNSAASVNMMKSGVARCATGENAVIVNSRRADIIVGPVGIVIADALLGEVTPASALAVGQSDAIKVLIPVSRCDNMVVGVKEVSLSALIAEAAEEIMKLVNSED
ncbi:MAG: DUF3842 family protein [Ruminococcaceae bacterium]|nr:DUF3842 family protein [Oscillospiraceae bacterium]